jgi:polysaccharide deacetylase family protein (PEP-CTERM system associated)
LRQLNALTIDVEDYFQVSAFERYVDRSQWDSYPLRVVENTKRILDLLDAFEVKATFFVLGWVAERTPGLVPEIKRRGHEIACHGYGHELIYRIGPRRFREDIKRAKAILEGQTSEAVLGYRAPSYSITKNSLWALDILVEEGFEYDSSIFPVLHDTYGIPDAEPFPNTIETGSGPLVEFPLTTLAFQLGSKQARLPIAGGGYLRLLPVGLIRYGMERINTRLRQPAVLYFHPWEIDPGQPRIQAGFKSTFRHYQNLAGTEGKLRHLLGRLRFASMREVLAPLLTPAAAWSAN